MSNQNLPEEYKEKFNPHADAKLDAEVDAALGELSVERLLDEAAPPTAAPANTEAASNAAKGLRHGKVIKVGADDVMVDFGGKGQGVCALSNFTEVKIGDEFEFHVERFDQKEGLLILTRGGSPLQNVNWESLNVGQVIEGTVTGMNKGGLEMSIKNMRAFLPAGQVDLFFHKDISVFLGQKFAVEVTQFDREKKNLVVSRRNILEREKAEARDKAIAEITEGAIRRGTVRSVMDYGAFVDLGGIDGLLHVSEITYKRVRNAAEVIKVGDVVDVKVVKIDAETGKISLSLKQARGIDPWADAATKYAPGTQITGRVTKVEAFGAFIEVEEGLEGLLPVSEISWQRIGKVSDVVKVGDTIKLVVLAIDAPQRRVTFSLKQAGPDPWKTITQRYATDMILTGTVTRTVDFGAFVELEAGLEGLIHISELDGKRVAKVTDVVKEGQEVRVKILDIDPEARRIALSVKRATERTGSPVMATGSKPAAGSPAPAAADEAKKKKRPDLRGGLSFDTWNGKLF